MLLKERVDADTANLTGWSFQIGKAYKLTKKLTPSEALQGMHSLEIMSENYKDVYHIYLRRLNRLIAGCGKKSADWKALKATAVALNIETGGRMSDEDFAKVLSRLRALEMTESPVV